MSGNVNDRERFASLGLDAPTKPYDVMWLDLDVGQLDSAVEAGYCNPTQTQNDSPNVAAFLRFADNMGGLSAPIMFLCYIVSPSRSDCRISVEGVRILDRATQLERVTFERWAAANKPDEFDPMRAWWD